MKPYTTIKLILFILLFALNSCTIFLEYEDVSDSPEFSIIINRTFLTKKVLIIHGVNMDDPIGKEVHQYSVTPLQGFAGREVRSRDELRVNTRIKLVKVLRCTNCYLGLGVKHSYVIDILSSDKYRDHEINMRENFGGVDLVSKVGEQYIFNPEYFESVNE